MPVPSPVFGWAKMPSSVPIPLSVTESFQSVPDTSNATVICPSLVLPWNACLIALMTSSVTINPDPARLYEQALKAFGIGDTSILLLA